MELLHFVLQVRDFHIAKREEDIGYYAGYIGNISFSLLFMLMGCLLDNSFF